MGGFVSGEAARERFDALADQVDAAYAEMRALLSAEVGNGYRAGFVERLEGQERTNRGLMYRFFGQIADPPDETAMAPALVNSLAARLRITPSEVKRRMKTAARLGERRQVSGPPLPPQLPQVAQAVAAGRIGEDHLRVITRALDVLPSNVSDTERCEVEASLVREAVKNDSAFVKLPARGVDEIFNPDGDFTDDDRARRRGLRLGRQGRDGMSRLAGYLDAEARAYLEAATTAVRPGRHPPDGSMAEAPDERSAAQRCHDGLKLGLKAGHRLGPVGQPSWASGDGDRAHHRGRAQPGRPGDE